MMKTSLSEKFCHSLVLNSTHTSLVTATYASLPADEGFIEEDEAFSKRLQILGFSRFSNNQSIKKGVVLNIASLTSSILSAVDEVERQTGIPVRSVRLGFSCQGAQLVQHVESIEIKSNEIKSSDVEKCLQRLKGQKPPAGYEYVHMIPELFSVDSKQDISDPIGMQGNLLTLSAYFVAVPQQDLHSLIKSCHNAGLRVSSFAFEPLAAAEGVLTLDEKESGCLSLSFGAELIHVSLYSKGVPIFTKEYALGSHHITKDLSIGLRTTQADAERIKKEFGSANSFLMRGLQDKIEILSVDGHGLRTVHRQDVIYIIEARVKEIFETIKNDLNKQKIMSKATHGIVLSGGGALLSGLATTLENTFAMNVRVGIPHHVFGFVEGLKSPLWSSAIGGLSPCFKSLHSEVPCFLQSDSAGFGSLANKLWLKIKEPFASRS